MKSIFIAVASIIVSILTWQNAIAEKTLRVTLQLPIEHHLGQNMLDFKQAVERETNGEIQIEIFPSAELYRDRDVSQAVSSGAIEMGIASLAVLGDTVPVADIFSVPFLFHSAEHVRRATEPDSPIRTTIDNEIMKTGVRVLWWQAFGGAIILSKGEPIRRPEDFKGKKVRVFGKFLGELVKVTGGEPVITSGSEQFNVYKKGWVEAGMTGFTTIPSRKLYQVMDFVSLINLVDIEFVVLINEKVWQELTVHQRDGMAKAARRVEKELRDRIQRIEAEAIESVRDKMTIVEINEEDLDAWRDATSSIINTYLTNTGTLGVKLVAEVRRLE